MSAAVVAAFAAAAYISAVAAIAFCAAISVVVLHASAVVVVGDFLVALRGNAFAFCAFAHRPTDEHFAIYFAAAARFRRIAHAVAVLVGMIIFFTRFCACIFSFCIENACIFGIERIARNAVAAAVIDVVGFARIVIDVIPVFASLGFAAVFAFYDKAVRYRVSRAWRAAFAAVCHADREIGAILRICGGVCASRFDRFVARAFALSLRAKCSRHAAFGRTAMIV